MISAILRNLITVTNDMNDEEPQMSYRRSYLSLTLIISYKKKKSIGRL